MAKKYYPRNAQITTSIAKIKSRIESLNENTLECNKENNSKTNFVKVNRRSIRRQ